VQLRYKDFNEYRADVSIVKTILAVDPLPKYDAVTPEKIVPYDVIVPKADTKAQEAKLQDPGKLKYYERATAVKVFKFEVPEY
jgi:hypothetical protein